MKDLQKQAHKEALREFRTKHFAEMEKNLKVAKSIRDSKEAKDKDKNEAIKIISRMLGTLQPDTVGKSQAAAVVAQLFDTKKPELPPAQREKLNKALNYEVE